MKLLFADDHVMFRDSMAIWLNKISQSIEITASHDYESTIDKLSSSPFDLLILDLFMPGMHGVLSVKKICQDYPNCKVLVVSAEDNQAVIKQCISYGAQGYVPKSSSGKTILKAISEVISGKKFIPSLQSDLTSPIIDSSIDLNEKQLKILALIAQGKSNKEIAQTIFLSEGTIKQYVSKLLRILQVDNRTQATNKASQLLGIEHRRF